MLQFVGERRKKKGELKRPRPYVRLHFKSWRKRGASNAAKSLETPRGGEEWGKKKGKQVSIAEEKKRRVNPSKKGEVSYLVGWFCGGGWGGVGGKVKREKREQGDAGRRGNSSATIRLLIRSRRRKDPDTYFRYLRSARLGGRSGAINKRSERRKEKPE